MDRRGIRRTTTVIALALVAALAIGSYALLGLQKTTSSGGTSSSAAQGQSPNPGGLFALFGHFPKMAVSYIQDDGETGTTTQTATYSVIGHKTVNSTDYFLVQFTNSPGNSLGNVTTVLWFNPQGNVTLAQAKGLNYTGQEAFVHSFFLTGLFSNAIFDGNSTLQLSKLQKVGQDTTVSIGGMQLSVSTYGDPSTLPQIISTVKIATVPNTANRLIILVNQTSLSPEGQSTVFLVNNLSVG